MVSENLDIIKLGREDAMAVEGVIHHIHKHVYMMTDTDKTILIKRVIQDFTQIVQSAITHQRQALKGPLN